MQGYLAWDVEDDLMVFEGAKRDGTMLGPVTLRVGDTLRVDLVIVAGEDGPDVTMVDSPDEPEP